MAKKNYMSKNSLAYFWQILKNTFAKKTELSNVATSGSYNDLSNKPTIPTKNSQLANDSGFIINEKEIFIGEEKDVPAEAKIIIDPSDIGTGIAFKDSVPINTIFEYDGDEVPDGYEEVKIEDKGDIYSTDEQKIGTWIDDKPLYRKVFYMSGTTSGEKSIDISSLNYEFIMIKNQCLKSKNFIFTNNRYNVNTPDDVIEYFIADNTKQLKINIGTPWANFKTYIVVEYTKTTD